MFGLLLNFSSVSAIRLGCNTDRGASTADQMETLHPSVSRWWEPITHCCQAARSLLKSLISLRNFPSVVLDQLGQSISREAGNQSGPGHLTHGGPRCGTCSCKQQSQFFCNQTSSATSGTYDFYSGYSTEKRNPCWSWEQGKKHHLKVEWQIRCPLRRLIY